MSSHFVAPSSLFYDPTNALIEMLDHLSSHRRKELLNEARPTPHPIKLEQNLHNQAPKGHTLVDDFDHRKLEVECDGSFAQYDRLPPLKRQLSQEGDMRVDFDDLGRITKIIKKREAEFLQGEMTKFTVDEQGRRSPIGDSEDIFERSEQLSITEEFNAPRDMWDLLFDATPFLQFVHTRINNFNKMSKQERGKVFEELGQKLIYSADFFPYHKFNPIYTRSTQIKQLINNNTISRGALYNFCNKSSSDSENKIHSLFMKARKMPPGKEKVELIIKATDIKRKAFIAASRASTKIARRLETEEAFLLAARHELYQVETQEEKDILKEEIRETSRTISNIHDWFNRTRMKSPHNCHYSEEMSISEKKQLWELLTQKTIESSGEARISEKRFKKLYYGILLKTYWKEAMKKTEEDFEAKKISRKEMNERVKKFKKAIWNKVNRRAVAIYHSEKNAKTTTTTTTASNSNQL